MRRVVGILLFGSVLGGCEPSTYEDCVLENINEARTAAAVSVVRHTCREKFPKTTERVSTLDAFGLDENKWRLIEEEDGVVRVMPINPETGLVDPFSEDVITLRPMPKGFDPFAQPPNDPPDNTTTLGQAVPFDPFKEPAEPQHQPKPQTKKPDHSAVDALIEDPYGRWE